MEDTRAPALSKSPAVPAPPGTRRVTGHFPWLNTVVESGILAHLTPTETKVAWCLLRKCNWNTRIAPVDADWIAAKLKHIRPNHVRAALASLRKRGLIAPADSGRGWYLLPPPWTPWDPRSGRGCPDLGADATETGTESVPLSVAHNKDEQQIQLFPDYDDSPEPPPITEAAAMASSSLITPIDAGPAEQEKPDPASLVATMVEWEVRREDAESLAVEFAGDRLPSLALAIANYVAAKRRRKKFTHPRGWIADQVRMRRPADTSGLGSAPPPSKEFQGDLPNGIHKWEDS